MMESLTTKGNVGERVGLGGRAERINHSVFTFRCFSVETPEENTEGNNQVGKGMALARSPSLF